jgi:hypothetical protein
MSAPEMRAALRAMRAMGYAAATLVSHSFELYTVADREGRVGRPSRVNLARWSALLDFLARERETFPTESAFELVTRFASGRGSLGTVVAVPRTPPHLELVRFAEQALKRLEPYLPVPSRAAPRSP